MVFFRLKVICLIILVASSFQGTAQGWEIRIDSFSSFGSPKAADLNRDGVKDIIVGCGFEFAPEDGVFAFDGANGDVLWFTPSESEIYGPPVFFDLTDDDIPDFVMNGRFGALLAIDGSTGEVLWKLSDDPALPKNIRTHLYYNVFTPCRIDDIDDDQIDEVMFTYGGGGGFTINDTLDHAFIGIASGANGHIIHLLPLPTNSQTYSPAVLLETANGTDVIAGTGGETHGGQLFRFPLSSLVGGNLSGIQIVTSNALKGYIQPPALADIDGDGQRDLLVANLDHQIFAYSGVDNRNLYTNYFPEVEFYGGVTPGYFNDDDALDISVLSGVGSWPSYEGYRRYIIDFTVGGGKLIDDIGGGFEVVNAGVSYQPDAMTRESRLIYTRNSIWTDTVHQVQVVEYDPFTETEYLLAELDSASVVGCVPLLHDLDGDGLMELVVVASDYSSGFGELDNRLIVKRIDLDRTGISHWDSYMGNLSDAHWQGETVITANKDQSAAGEWNISIYPNPFHQSLILEGPAEWEPQTAAGTIRIYSIDGKAHIPSAVELRGNALHLEFDRDLPSGIYRIGLLRNQVWQLTPSVIKID